MIRFLIFILIIAGLIFYAVDNGLIEGLDEYGPQENEFNEPSDNTDAPANNDGTAVEDVPDSDKALADWIDDSEEEMTEEYGEPAYSFPTPYGYTWYVYSHSEQHVMFGIKEGRIVTAHSSTHNSKDVMIGDSYEEVSGKFDFDREQDVSGSFQSFTFELTEEEVRTKPLINIEGDVWGQFYFDIFDNSLSSVRYMTDEVLVLQRPYSLTFSGSLPEEDELDDSETEAWQIGQGRQIFDITNIIRNRYGLQPLEWHDGAAETAYLHSRDMYTEEFFSHTSPVTGTLSDRLDNTGVSYRMAGENIAAMYTDAVEATEGWLNSEGHRENLLNSDFTHLGTGVHRQYYTQNFLIPH